MVDIEGPLPPTEPSERQENSKTVWQQYQTEDGADYYANTETGRTTWTPKSSAVSGVESETTLETMEDGTMEDDGGIHSSSSGVDAVDVALDTAAPPIVTMQRLKGQEDSEESKDSSSSVGGSTSNSSSGGVDAVDVSWTQMLTILVIQSHQTAGKCLAFKAANGSMLTFTVPPGLVVGDILLIDTSKIIFDTFI